MDLKSGNIFGKKRVPKVKAQPPEFWEENSCMMAIVRSGYDPMNGIIDRLQQIKGITPVKHFIDGDRGGFGFTADGEEYEIQFSLIPFESPDPGFYRTASLTQAEIEETQRADKAVSTVMKFHGDGRKSYHLQLKLIYAMVPELASVYDESSEHVVSPRFVKMSALSDVPPAPSRLYCVQAISDENSDEVWLHTHGLCRCGLTELEIIKSDQEHCDDHYNLISVLANRMLDGDEDDPGEDVYYLGRLSDGTPIVAATVPWEEGIWEYGRLELGGMRDRENGHNTRSSLIFMFTSEENEKNRLYTKVNTFDKLWGDNPMFLLSNSETERMSAAARERFEYVRKSSSNEKNGIIIKLGLPTTNTDEMNREHIWFELIGFEPDGSFRATLTQEPYYIEGLHEGDVGVYSVDQVTDWRIFTESGMITPDDAYMLMEE